MCSIGNENRAVNKLPQFAIALLAVLVAFPIGTYLAWPSLALPLYYSKNGTLRLNDVEGSWISSLIPLSAALAVLPAGILAEEVGRKVTLCLITLPLCICWFVLDFSEHKFWIYLSCVTIGAACGTASIVVPLYVSEIADSKVRKHLGRIFHVFLSLGIFFVDITGLEGNLHNVSTLCTVVPAFLLLTFPFVPESPAWLITHERRKDAECVIRCLRGKSSSLEVQTNEFHLARGFYGLKSGIGELVYYKRATVVIIGLAICQQLSGVGAVIFYTREIFDRVGSNLNSGIDILILGIVQVIAASLSTTLMCHVGQKLLLFLSLSGTATSMFILAGYFHFQNISDVSKINWLPLFSLIIFTGSFNVGLGPIPWKMADTFFISHMKRAASSAMILCNWSLAFVVTKSFRNLMDLTGPSTSFAIFGLFSLFGTAFVAYMVPETEGRSIKEIQLELNGERDSGFQQSINQI